MYVLLTLILWPLFIPHYQQLIGLKGKSSIGIDILMKENDQVLRISMPGGVLGT